FRDVGRIDVVWPVGLDADGEQELRGPGILQLRHDLVGQRTVGHVFAVLACVRGEGRARNEAIETNGLERRPAVPERRVIAVYRQRVVAMGLERTHQAGYGLVAQLQVGKLQLFEVTQGQAGQDFELGTDRAT